MPIPEKFCVTVDIMYLYTKRNFDEKYVQQNMYILLIKRGKDPFKDMWALPGGFVDLNENPEAAAKRELEEETGRKVEHVHFTKFYADEGRDPRGPTLSCVFTAQEWGTDEPPQAQGLDDAIDARWFNIHKKLPPLAFDHYQMIRNFTHPSWDEVESG